MFKTKVKLDSGVDVFQLDLGDYWIDYIERSSTLVLAFDSAGGPDGRPNSLRDSWGQAYLLGRGYSIVGVKPRRVDWYRGKRLHETLRSEEFKLFLSQFSDRVFYGTSMGGYAALAFSDIAPGSLVISHNPQSTLDSRLVPWEHRFGRGRSQNWDGDFRDGADARFTARRIYTTYDPFHETDRKHVERVSGPVTTALKMPFLGHGTPEWLLRMRVLKEVSALAFEEKLDEVTFAKLMRNRRTLPRYYIRMYERTRSAKVKVRCLEEGARIDPSDGELIFLRLLDYFARKDFSSFVALYRQNPTLKGLPRSKNGEVHAIIATVLNRIGQTEEAIRLADRAANLSSDNIRDLVFMSDFYSEVGHYSRAEEFGRAAIKLAPKRATAHLALAVAVAGQKRLAEAWQLLLVGETLSSNASVDKRYRSYKRTLETQLSLESTISA